MERFQLVPGEPDIGKRLDRYIGEQIPALTRNAVQRLCEQGLVRVGAAAAAKNHKVRLSDRIVVEIPEPKALDVVAQDIPLSIVYEDEDLLVVDKPKGLVVHPAPGNEDGTLVNALLHHCQGRLSGIGGVARPGIVHRIDKDTSGLLVVAKTDLAHGALSAQIKDHTVTRRYRAVVYGNVKTDAGRIEASIGRHPNDRKRMCVTDRNAREAATQYTVLERLTGFTYLELQLKTGRTHQIRVHMAYVGHPVAGDPVYGPKKCITALGGQCLHACTLGFVHPRTGNYLEFQSELPDYFSAFLRKNKQGPTT